MTLKKSSRHSKITGDFAERFVLYWLSKYGFECAYVDRTGIDIIARNPHTKELMGISVKSRSRNVGKEEEYVSLPKENFEKAKEACKAFGCTSYFAIVVDAGNEINMFILPTKRLLKYFPVGKTATGWYMTKKHRERYLKDPEIIIVNFKHQIQKWWKT